MNQHGIMVGIVNIFLSWIPTYLMQVKGYPILKVGIVALMPWIGGVLGNLVWGGFRTMYSTNKLAKISHRDLQD